MDPILGMLTLGVANWVIGLLSVAFLFCSVLLVLTVLIQRPQGGGLSGAFGAGAGSGETAFGARTGDALTIATISFFVIWLLVAVGLVWVMQPPEVTTGTQATSNQGEAPAQTPAGTEQNIAPPVTPETTPPGAEPGPPPADGADAPADGAGQTPPPAGEDTGGQQGGGEAGDEDPGPTGGG